MSDTIAQVQGATKRFPGVVALKGVDFTLRSHTIHSLLGENGAGKSTLIKCLAGYYAPDEGSIHIGGEPLKADTKTAREAGVETIHQEHQLVPYLTVAENVMLGSWPTRAGMLDSRRMVRVARQVLDRIAPEVHTDQLAARLSPAQGQLVEIARAMVRDARVLILDEPTTSLGQADTERLFALLKDLRSRGLGILYVSHILEEAFELSDEITVMRDGELVSSGPATEYDRARVIREMVGAELKESYREAIEHDTNVAGSHPRLEVRNLSRRGVIREVSFEVRPGEIVALAGLVGAGRTEIVRCVFGADPIDEGAILVDGVTLTLRSPIDAIKAGIGLVPEERKLEGIFPNLSVAENVVITERKRRSRHGVVKTRWDATTSKRFVRDLRVRTPGVQTLAATLSGGNQQKLVISRWLATNPKVLLLDEPTKGIDIGAKGEIHSIIRGLADDGVAIVVVSSELPELLALADRILVVHQGRIVKELHQSEASKEAVMRYATGG